MSWAGPDRKTPGAATPPKPFCAERPTPAMDQQWLVDKYIHERGLQPNVAKENLWYPSITANDGELRVVIPCTSSNLTNRYWQARVVDDTHITPRIPRYTSPKHVTRGDALAVVHPLSMAKSKFKGICLVEGPFDALAAACVGCIGIGWMGTAPGEDPILFAQRLIANKGPVFVIQDRGATKEALAIWERFPGAFLVDPYPHKDLADVPEDDRRQLLWAY